VEVDAPTPAPDDGEQLFNFDVRRYVLALRKYALAMLAMLAVAVTLAVIYTNRQPEIYVATASVQIEPRMGDLMGQRADLLVRASVGGLDYYAQQKKLLGSYSLVRRTVEEHQLYKRMFTESQREGVRVEKLVDWATGRLLANLRVSYPEENRTMYVSVYDHDPQLAADMANAHVETYVLNAQGLLKTDTKQASGALSTELELAEKQLRDAEADLFEFQKENDLVAQSPEDKQGLTSSEITAYTTRFNEARAKRIELSSRLDRMRKVADEDVLRSPVLAMDDSVAVDSLRSAYYTEKTKFTEMEKVYGPKTSEYQMQKAKVDEIYSSLQSESRRLLAGLEEQVKAAAATESALGAEIARARKDALAGADTIRLYNQKLRIKNGLEERYNEIRKRLSTSESSDRINNSYDASNVKPLDPALVPSRAVYPRLRKNIAIAAALSLFLSFGMLFLIVFLDRSIKSTADAQQAAGAPVLGIIPIIDSRELPDGDERARDLFVHAAPTSRVAECARSIRTNVLFSSADRHLKTIVVSSANPREGKTTSCIYLGTTMAQGGQRVLLIDTDMRRPRLHVSLGVPRQTGLSNLILGDRDYDDVIRTTDVTNLYVLPCGPLPPNPAELLMTNRFEAVLEELGKRFDRIILDSPPVGAVTDAVVLSKSPCTDGVILVANAGKTQREELKRASRQLRVVGGNVFGVIVNSLAPDSGSGYYYSAYYGYGEKGTNESKPTESQA
jgi:capsular exopolysaccharide synthesis family protein